MGPGARVSGIAGMAAGILLIFETSFFLLSGWSPPRFADPSLAMDLIRQGGDDLRAAAVFGFVGLIATVLLLAGLAEALQVNARACAAGQLYLGLVGVAGHSLVPLTLWIGVPAFRDLAAKSPSLAQSGWAGFAPISNGAHGVSSLFLGCSMVLAGAGLAQGRGWSRWAGGLGVAAGGLTLATLLTAGTPLEAAAGALFMPSLALTVLFRFLAGVALWRGALQKVA